MSNTTKPDLLPCPFCGSTSLFFSYGCGWVACNNCDCSSAILDDDSEAVAAWNRRAGSTQPAAEPKRRVIATKRDLKNLLDEMDAQGLNEVKVRTHGLTDLFMYNNLFGNKRFPYIDEGDRRYTIRRKAK